MKISQDEMLLRARVAHLEQCLEIAMNALEQVCNEDCRHFPDVVAKYALAEIRKHQKAVSQPKESGE